MIKIYGKDNCGNCVAAKNLLDSRGLAYEYLTLGSDFTIEEIKQIASNAQSFPQIFLNGDNIGGYHQLVTKIGLIEGQTGGSEVLLG